MAEDIVERIRSSERISLEVTGAEYRALLALGRLADPEGKGTVKLDKVMKDARLMRKKAGEMVQSLASEGWIELTLPAKQDGPTSVEGASFKINLEGPTEKKTE